MWHPLLYYDRAMAGKPFRQIVAAFIIFVSVLLMVAGIYFLCSGRTLGQTFVDMVSPVTVQKEAYKDTNPWLVVLGFSTIYTIGTIFFTGYFVATITNFIRTRADKFKQGTVKYPFRHHIVFLGYDDLIIGMIQKLCDDGQKRIVVGVENNASDINDRIKNRLFNEHKDKVVVLQADGCNRSELERLRIPFADCVYIIGEHDDAYNLKSYRTIYELSLCKTNFRERMPQCYVNLRHKSTLALFQTYATAGDIGVDFSAFHAFNFNDEWARYMICGDGLKKESRIDYRDDDSNNVRQVHLVIAGMTEMGRALARQAMLECHYPNNISTKITFIDPQTELLSKQLIGSHQKLFEHCHYAYYDSSAQLVEEHHPKKEETLDIEFEYYVADISDIPIREKLKEWCSDECQLLTIAICLPKASQSFAAGIHLPKKFFDKKIPVWIYQPTYGNLGNYLRGSSYYNNIVTFGMSGEQLDICNKNTIDKAKLINHCYHNWDKNGEVNYDNPLWIDAEWQAIDVNERWMYINRASRLSAIRHMVKDFSNLDDKDIEKITMAEMKRMKIEGLIVPESSSSKPIHKEELRYLKVFQEINKTSTI